MTVALRAVTTPTQAAASSLVVNKPTGTLTGDLVALIGYQGNGGAPRYEVPTGFVEVPTAYIGGNNGIQIFIRIATAGEPATYTLAMPGGVAATVVGALMSFYSDTAQPLYIEAIATLIEDVVANVRVWPTVEVASAQQMLAYIGSFSQNTQSVPTGATERWDNSTSPRSYAMTEPHTGAGETPEVSATANGGITGTYRHVTLAIAEGAPAIVLGPQHRATGVVATGNVTGSQSATIPATVEVGDLLIAQLGFATDRTPALPAAWLPVPDGLSAGLASLHSYYKIAEEGDAGALVTATFATPAVQVSMAIHAWYSPRGYDLAIADSANQANGSATSHPYPTLTIEADNAGLAYLLTSSASSSAPAATWERYDGGDPHIFAMTELTYAPGESAARASVTASSITSRAVTILIVEIPPAPLDASGAKFLRVQAGKQVAFDAPTIPTVALPVVFEYADADLDQIAKWDPGAWTPLTIVEQIAQFATFKLRGTLFFETLPLLLSAGFGDMEPTGLGPYSYADSVAPGATGTPAAFTFRFGGNDASRYQGSMVQVQDAYLHSLTLSFNMNDKVVLFESEWFGRYVDDNAGIGYTPAAVALPPSLAMVQGLLSTLAIQDAGSAGGAFDVLEQFECSLMEWTLTIDTGLRPAWAGDGNALTYCGIRHEWPSASFAAHLRTNLENYAVTKVKANLHMFQELQLSFFGADSRQAAISMTGRWLPRFRAHDRSREEVVLKPTFQVETPGYQAPGHWMSYAIDSQWSGA